MGSELKAVDSKQWAILVVGNLGSGQCQQWTVDSGHFYSGH
jgi:hypothetical protein